ncbi:hypothetical protein SK128_015600 [Halocaridina rubra]|uniref:Peptidase S1 domain-containing protein n=1 Tax=Halocaridina rubra TaxID=373956 RepID=A0AAN8ZZ84_HALRR
MGAHNIRNSEPEQVSMTSTNFFTHENWNSFTLANDIALIRLPSAVGLDQNIATVGLAASDPAVGTTVTPTGWGRPSDSKCQNMPLTYTSLALEIPIYPIIYM